MKKRKAVCACLLLALCLLLSGCRIRTGTGGPAGEDRTEEPARGASAGPEKQSAEGEREEKSDEPGGITKENPESSRKEYDETAPAELVPGTGREVYEEGDGSGLYLLNGESEDTADRLKETAEQPAIQTVEAEEADRTGTAEGAEEADSALTYYTVLLRERTGALYECKREYVYWETKEDHVTIFRTSQEHEMILEAGTYDVSARLLQENLRVDDGWIARKNPGVIVKIVGADILGHRAAGTGAAQQVYNALLRREGWDGIDAVRNGRIVILSEEMLQAPHLRVMAELIIAKAANPESFADTETGTAFEKLSEEATGSLPAGIYYYCGQGGMK